MLSLFEFITHQKQGERNLRAAFGVLAEEEESLVTETATADRDDLPLAAAGKPPANR